MTYDEPHLADLERVVRRIDPLATLLAARPLHGGVSARVTALDVRRADGEERTLVLRRHGAADLAANPGVAAAEFRLLRLLSGAGLPVPEPLLVDASGEVLAGPFLVQAFVVGAVRLEPGDARPRAEAMAAQLAAVHRFDATAHGLTYLPRQAERVERLLAHPPAVVDESLDEGRIRAALGAVWPSIATHRHVLLHGDYWPGNLLWRGDRIAGVLDWEDAAVGDPLADVGNARLELLWAWGREAMTAFTERYLGSTGVDPADLPAWDLVAALRPAGKLSDWGLEPATVARMRRAHAQFVEHAVARLSGRRHEQATIALGPRLGEAPAAETGTDTPCGGVRRPPTGAE